MKMEEIGKLIREQDNRCTAVPVFIVQQLWRVCGVSHDYTDSFFWQKDGDEADESEHDMLTQLSSEGKEVPSGWDCVGYIDRWEFVTVCFTEKGCEDYIRLNGHNLTNPRIYVASGCRNEELQAVRRHLIGLSIDAEADQ